MSTETDPLLRRGTSHQRTTQDGSSTSLALQDSNGKARQKLGLFSTALLIFNRVIGTGIFATPAMILRASGSVGLSLVLWLVGAVVASCGTAVFVELGTAIPINGGEKNYLEFIYRRPAFLSTCIYAVYTMLIGWQAAATSVFGEYAIHAIDPTQPPSPFSARLASLLCITIAFLIHSTNLKWGVRILNTLAILKLVVLLGMALTGLAVLARIPGFKLEKAPRNFEWNFMWEGSMSGGANAFVTGLYNIIWSFWGYSNANYALSEVHDPVRTIKRAAPLALLTVTLVYMLVNIGYYAVVDRDELLGSGRIAAALFFGKIWGMETEQILSAIVALSCFGNVLAVLFSHGRVIQELGREGVLPFSSFFASNKPFNAPLPGMFQQWLVTSILVVAVPAGDAFDFMLNLTLYPVTVFAMLISGGVLFMHLGILKYEWNPPFRTYTTIAAFYFLTNVFLVFAPLIPPASGWEPYRDLPYWSHVAVSFSISLLGIIYWYIKCVFLPARGGYYITKSWRAHEDGEVRSVWKKVRTD